MQKPLEWSIRDFSGGLVDKLDDNELADNQASDCQNVISTKIGSITSVPGQVKLNSVELGGPIQGLHSYYNGAIRKFVAVANGVPYYWDAIDKVFREITLPDEEYPTGLDTSAMVQFATLVNYMVSFNGVDKPWKWEVTTDATTISVLENAPADGQYCVLFKEKLFTVPKSEPSTLRWSDSFAPEEWPEVNFWNIAKGDGDIITALVPYLGELTIFKRYSIHSLRGTSIDDFVLDNVVPTIGCVGPRAVVQEGLHLYFVSDEGICVYNGAKVTNLTRSKIPNLWDKINHEYIHKAVAGRWEGLLWFALPENSNTFNNLVILYDPLTGAFWPRRNIEVNCFQEYNNGQKVLFYSGGSYDGFVRQQYTGKNDDDKAINSYWIGKAFDMGQPEYQKKLKKVLVSDGPNANDAGILLSLDYGEFQELTYKDGDDLVRRFNAPSDRCRYIRPKIVFNTKDKSFEVRGIMALYKPKQRPK
jgi:hypothetical protein